VIITGADPLTRSRSAGSPSPQKGEGCNPTKSRGSGVGRRPPLVGKPDAVLVIGLCGRLTGSLREQHIVAYTECLSTGLNKAPPRRGPRGARS
jgi:hypothetical protein